MDCRPNINSLRNIGINAVALSVLSGCLLGEEDSSVDVDPGTMVELSGSVGDGPIVGADVRVTAADGALITEFVSDSSASYEVSFDAGSAQYPLLVTATGGTDLVTNSAPDFVLSGAVFAMQDDSIANVNPFSTIAVNIAQRLPGGFTRENLEEAQRIVASAMNSGLSTLQSNGPMVSRIDASNVSEIVRASEAVAELVRRTQNLMQAAGFSRSTDAVVESLGADLTDSVVDGMGANDADARIAAVSTIVGAQILIETMANELHVNGFDASAAMRSAIESVSNAAPNPSLDELRTTDAMRVKARIGLAAAFALDDAPAIRQLHEVVSGIQSGRTSASVSVVLPGDYRSLLNNALSIIANADSATIDLVNAIARTNGDLEPANLAPTIEGNAPTMVSVGTPYSFQPSASDVNGDPLTFSVENLPSWANFDQGTGRVFGTPAVSDVGTFANIRIRVTDGIETTSLAPFSITVVASNTAPTISGTPTTSVTVGQSYLFTPSASDADGDALTFSISNAPAWASFDQSTGQLSGTPGSADVGSTNNIVVSVSDAMDSSSLAPFSISVAAVNSPPSISGSPATSVNAGEAYSFTPTASDVDGDSLTFSVSGLPSWASFDAGSGRVSGAPVAADVGVYSSIVITVSDGQASVDLSPFSITVEAISLGSVTLTWTAPTENDDGSPLTDLAGYRIYWGTEPGNYTNSIVINNASVTNYVVENLSPGTYEFVGTAFNSAGVESRYSAPASRTLP